MSQLMMGTGVSNHHQTRITDLIVLGTSMLLASPTRKITITARPIDTKLNDPDEVEVQ